MAFSGLKKLHSKELNSENQQILEAYNQFHKKKINSLDEQEPSNPNQLLSYENKLLKSNNNNLGEIEQQNIRKNSESQFTQFPKISDNIQQKNSQQNKLEQKNSTIYIMNGGDEKNSIKQIQDKAIQRINNNQNQKTNMQLIRSNAKSINAKNLKKSNYRYGYNNEGKHSNYSNKGHHIKIDSLTQEEFQILSNKMINNLKNARYLQTLKKIKEQVLDDQQAWVYTSTTGDGVPIIESDWGIKYAESLYWSQATIMLIGSKGSTYLETIFVCLCLFFTVGIFGTLLSRISQILEDMSNKTKSYRRDLEIINRFFQENNHITKELQGKILNFVRSLNQGHSTQQQNYKLNQLLLKFPDNMQKIIKKQRYSKPIEEFSILKVTKGQVQLGYQIIEQENDIRVCKTIKEGEIFGQDGFFADRSHEFSALSNDFTSLISIKRSDFLRLLQKNKKDFQLFHLIKDNYIFNSNVKEINRVCIICNSAHHIEYNCQTINYNPNKEMLILKYNYWTPQEQNQNWNRNIFKFNVLANINKNRYFYLKQFSLTEQKKDKNKEDIKHNGYGLLQDAQQKIIEEPDMRKYIKEIQENQKLYNFKYIYQFNQLNNQNYQDMDQENVEYYSYNELDFENDEFDDSSNEQYEGTEGDSSFQNKYYSDNSIYQSQEQNDSLIQQKYFQKQHSSLYSKSLKQHESKKSKTINSNKNLQNKFNKQNSVNFCAKNASLSLDKNQNYVVNKNSSDLNQLVTPKKPSLSQQKPSSAYKKQEDELSEDFNDSLYSENKKDDFKENVSPEKIKTLNQYQNRFQNQKSHLSDANGYFDKNKKNQDKKYSLQFNRKQLNQGKKKVKIGQNIKVENQQISGINLNNNNKRRNTIVKQKQKNQDNKINLLQQQVNRMQRYIIQSQKNYHFRDDISVPSDDQQEIFQTPQRKSKGKNIKIIEIVLEIPHL
ncbi:Cyclic nucleotide-binding protein [Pseudocohnilembus persalinus]|uniref:Cyclic nucleotide-binding protein n=1 Tax=Pseudocohnilembus persalinus TaxID=266149 RepID=A0A0V0QYW5_PSEPJ|nr:Cyclic nucleotide-binding protein [Pseudocohnilembus persalinus]|eukprot:KRX07422.1 Cyclic nucleotide-binding protein [Pseudocohnilembus persalinus]